MYGQAICYIFTNLKLSFASIDFYAERMVQFRYLGQSLYLGNFFYIKFFLKKWFMTQELNE